MHKGEAYWDHLNKVLIQTPPINAEQSELLTKFLAPKGREFVPKHSEGRDPSVPEPSNPVLRTPEEVAPELGMKPTELRRYCRTTGLCTRLSNWRIMLDAENSTAIIAWVKGESAKPVYLANGEIDHFA